MSALDDLKEIDMEVITPLEAAVVKLSQQYPENAAVASVELRDLREGIDRIKTFAAGRGMASEADGIEEIVVLITGLHDKIQRLETEIAGLEARVIGFYKKMPHCGHEARFVVQADEGTAWCALCELEATRASL